MSKRRASEKDSNTLPDAIVQRIYVGPAITYLRPGMIFTGELPAGIRGHVDACPEISDLFVPVADYTQAKNEVERKGSQLWFSARKVAQKLV